jgi:hypothetical protein
MCKFKTLGVSWPPKGWKKFEKIEYSQGQAILKNPTSAIVTGMSYSVEPVPVYLKNNRRVYAYAVQIEGWDYNIYNESCEYPVLSFMLYERPNSTAPKHFYISKLKTQAQPLKITQRSAHRAFMAALFMMKQINSGKVPEAERILRLYKIHATQRNLYDVDRGRRDSLFCGIAEHGTDDINSKVL